MILKGLLKTYYDSCKSYIVKDKKEFEDKVKRLKLESKYLKEIERYSLSTGSDELRTESIKDYLEKYTKELKRVAIAEKNLTKQDLVNDFQMLNHHAFMKKVEIKEDHIDIYTKKLKFQGNEIGNYLIKIFIHDLSDGMNIGDRIRIKNLEKRIQLGGDGNHFDHWFVEEEKPCFNQWKEVIKNYLLKGNLFLTGCNLVQFLLSTGNHGFLDIDRWISIFNESGENKEIIERSPDPAIPSPGITTATGMYTSSGDGFDSW